LFGARASTGSHAVRNEFIVGPDGMTRLSESWRARERPRASERETMIEPQVCNSPETRRFPGRCAPVQPSGIELATRIKQRGALMAVIE
jgi:hypothetical protein